MVSKEYKAIGRYFFRKKRLIIAGVTLVLGSVLYYVCLPSVLFDVPYSTVLLDREGNLLNASISSDGQWRFPYDQQVPDKFREAIVAYEDKRFFSHPGIDVFALARAISQNLKAGKIVSGGSTLTMQVMRMSGRGQRRNAWNKFIEIIRATRLELSTTKPQILTLYAAHAPFGGNVVGIEAACWRYFGRQPDALSWGEAALLAVLPNNPSLINLSKNREVLRLKRDGLLRRLFEAGTIDELSYELALSEEIPESPLPLPRLAPHLLTRLSRDGHAQERVTSTVSQALQERVTQILADHHRVLAGNQIRNIAALVLDVRTGSVEAYIGNVEAGKAAHEDVDIIAAPRSTGSILKPFLFAAMLDDGSMLPRSLVADVPTVINGFAPNNFSREYDGAVPADQALIRSLNVPAVRELREYRYEKFYTLLKETGLSTLTKPADHYGLAMILGGAEGTLWEITGAYASMARTLENYFAQPGKREYRTRTFFKPHYADSDSTHGGRGDSPFSAASLYLTFEALKEVYRPGEETGWKHFHSSKTIAWKTGTSYGFRDGWAVGVTPTHAVGVWVGNADGEGRPGLTGTVAAAPVMFDIFSQLSGSGWFERPTGEMIESSVCKQSGHRVSVFCTDGEKMWIAKSGLQSAACPYHKSIHLTSDGRYRVHASCEQVSQIKASDWFILPPIQEHFYKSLHLSYRALPPYRAGCQDPSGIAAMEMIYPRDESRIFVPRELDGQLGSTIFQVAHRDPKAVVYWHLDGQYIGSTKKMHRLPFAPGEGAHMITIVDEQGEMLERAFEVISAR